MNGPAVNDRETKEMISNLSLMLISNLLKLGSGRKSQGRRMVNGSFKGRIFLSSRERETWPLDEVEDRFAERFLYRTKASLESISVAPAEMKKNAIEPCGPGSGGSHLGSRNMK